VLFRSGTTYAIADPNLVVVMKSEMFVAFPGEDRWAFVPLRHIPAIETLQAA